MYDRTPAGPIGKMSPGEADFERTRACQTQAVIMAEPPRVRSEVAERLEQQQKAVLALTEAIHQLESRLRPILSPSPENVRGDGAEQGCGSEIAGCIAANTAGIVAAMRTIARLQRDLAI